MIEQLQGYEPLSQVWFVHDYIQLQFQDRTVSIFNTPQIHDPERGILYRDSEGFCDLLVAQINQRLSDAVLVEETVFTLVFENHVKLVIPITAEAAHGPEAVEVGTWIVFNA
ncbi:hypothetical protein [Nevskia sp.]|uniref:hypothetical protein n=1 Tax=Nevskia sp. TaxID=1929292 RepID=UPI0025D7C75F|nr:hypothetical protein [Nevskia sp.]